jgi:hypothetical protein
MKKKPTLKTIQTMFSTLVRVRILWNMSSTHSGATGGKASHALEQKHEVNETSVVRVSGGQVTVVTIL